MLEQNCTDPCYSRALTAGAMLQRQWRCLLQTKLVKSLPSLCCPCRRLRCLPQRRRRPAVSQLRGGCRARAAAGCPAAPDRIFRFPPRSDSTHRVPAIAQRFCYTQSPCHADPQTSLVCSRCRGGWEQKKRHSRSLPADRYSESSTCCHVCVVRAVPFVSDRDELYYRAGPAEAVKQLGPGIASVLGGKGGGRPGMYSGKATLLERRQEAEASLMTYMTSNSSSAQ